MNNEEKILSILEVLLEQGNDLRDGQANLEEKMDRLEGRMDRLEGRMDKLEGEVRELRLTVVKIENEHGQRLDALSDGYKLLSDKIEDFRKAINRIDKLEDQMIFVNLKLKSV